MNIFVLIDLESVKNTNNSNWGKFAGIISGSMFN